MVSELESYLVKRICLKVSLKILLSLRWAPGLTVMERTPPLGRTQVERMVEIVEEAGGTISDLWNGPNSRVGLTEQKAGFQRAD